MVGATAERFDVPLALAGDGTVTLNLLVIVAIASLPCAGSGR